MRTLLLAALLVILFSSCRLFGGKRIKGSGNVVTREQSVGAFESIDAGGAVTVYLKQDATPSVKVETDDNLLEYVDIRTDGSTLVIQTKKGFNLDPSKEVTVYVSAPSLREVGISGASKLMGQGVFTGDRLSLTASGASEAQLEVDLKNMEADASGASTVRMRGKAASFSSEASGASELECLDLATEEATLDVSGASNAKITANKQLTVEASGASNVEYRGNADVKQESSGASSVKKI